MQGFKKIGVMLGIVFLVLVLATLAISGCAPKPPAAKVTLSVVSGWTTADVGSLYLGKFVERINKEAKTVKIDYKGGPEVVPALEGLTYVSKGTIDLWHGTPPYYTGKIPSALASLAFVASQAEERKAGFWDLFDKLHREKAGVTALGQLWRGDPFGCFLNKPISKADLTGLKLRTLPFFDPFAKALGAAVVTLPPGEIYTALERGLIDGFMYPYGPGFIEQKWYEVVKYVVHPRIPYETCAPLLANVARWDPLPKEAKDEIMKVILDMEPELYEWYKKEAVKSIDWAVQKGYIKVIELPPAEGEKWVRTAKEELWKFIVEKDPVYGPKFKELAAKMEKK